MNRLAACLAIAVTFLVSASLRAQDILVESRSGGKNYAWYKEVAGTWEDSNVPTTHSKSQAPGCTANIGSRKFRFKFATPGPHTARFNVTFPKDGHYHVYATWPKAANATPVTYVIKHAKGETTRTLTQNGFTFTNEANANFWVMLGDYDFKAGEGQYVDLNLLTNLQPAIESQNWQAFSDSVLFAEKPVPGAVNGDAKVPLPEQVVVESRAEGKNFANYKEVEGNWINSGDATGRGKSGAPGLDRKSGGTRKFVFITTPDGKAGEAAGAARFSPNLPGKGKYNVYVTWPREANAEPVKYIVRHAAGSQEKLLIQNGWGIGGNADGNKWHHLGEFEFVPGLEQFVEVRVDKGARRPDSRNLGQVFADAVMFSQKPLETVENIKAPPPPPTNLVWLNSIDSALQEAATANKKILLFFYSAENPVSAHYMKNVFDNANVKSALGSGYVLARINFAENASRASQLGVFKAGTLIVYSSNGQPLTNKIDGYKSAEEVVTELKKLN